MGRASQTLATGAGAAGSKGKGKGKGKIVTPNSARAPAGARLIARTSRASVPVARRHAATTRGNMNSTPDKGSLRRMAKRSGHVRISKDAIDAVRADLHNLLRTLVRACLILTDGLGKQQVTAEHVDYVLKNHTTTMRRALGAAH